MNTPVFSTREALRFGWDVASRNTGFLVVILVVSGVLDGIPGAIQEATAETLPLVSFAFGLLTLFVSTVTTIGQTKIALRFADGEQPTHDDLYAHYRLFFRFLSTTIVYLLVVALGLVLFVVPGVIWLIRYGASPYLVVDKGMGTREAMRTSSEITQGVRWQLFRFTVASLVLVVGVLGLVLAGVGALGYLGIANRAVLGTPLAVLLLLIGVLIVALALLRVFATVYVASAHVYRRLMPVERATTPALPAMKWA